MPKVSKMDKASVLSDAVQYVTELRERVAFLESQAAGRDARDAAVAGVARSTPANQAAALVEDACPSSPQGTNVNVEVRMIDCSAIITVKSPRRAHLQSDIMLALERLKLDVQHANVATFGHVVLSNIIADMENDNKLSAKQILSVVEQAAASHNQEQGEAREVSATQQPHTS